VCVVLQRFSQHQADVLVLASESDGSTLLSAGVDSRVMTYGFNSGTSSGSEERWTMVGDDVGFHTHDVRALSLGLARGDRKYVSGGVDGALMVNQVKTLSISSSNNTGGSSFRRAVQEGSRSNNLALRRLRPLECSAFSPFFQTAKVADECHLLLSQHETNLELWYLEPPKQVSVAKALRPGIAHVAPDCLPEAQLVLKMSLQGAEDGHHITASAITSDGRLIAASDALGTRLFGLKIKELEVRKATTLTDEISKLPARALLFCGPKLLAIAAWRTPELLLVEASADKPTAVVARFSEHHKASVTHLASSPGGEWLASSDAQGVLHLFSLDSLQHHCRVPTGDGFPTALAFDSRGKKLVAVLSTHAVIVFDIEEKRLATGLNGAAPIPPQVVPYHMRICGASMFNLQKSEKVLLWGHTFIAVLDLDEWKANLDKTGAKENCTNTLRRGKRDSKQRFEQPLPPGWRMYPRMRYILALKALDETQWGAPVLKGQTDLPEMEEEGEKAAKKRRNEQGALMAELSTASPSVQARVLTLEVTPMTVKKSLPTPFERKIHGTARAQKENK